MFVFAVVVVVAIIFLFLFSYFIRIQVFNAHKQIKFLDSILILNAIAKQMRVASTTNEKYLYRNLFRCSNIRMRDINRRGHMYVLHLHRADVMGAGGSGGSINNKKNIRNDNAREEPSFCPTTIPEI